MTSLELLAVGAFLVAWTIEAAILKLNPGWLCNAGIPAFWCEQKLPISNGEPPSAALIEQHLPEPIAKDLELRNISSHEIAIIETVGYAPC